MDKCPGKDFCEYAKRSVGKGLSAKLCYNAGICLEHEHGMAFGAVKDSESEDRVFYCVRCGGSVHSKSEHEACPVCRGSEPLSTLT